MKIARVDAFALKLPEGDFFGGEASDGGGAHRYVVQPGWRGVYSNRIETMLVRVETDTGLVGWGEGQAPIAPEVAAMAVDTIIKDCLIGREALQTETLRDEMYGFMNLRGHGGGFMVDAIAGVDTALWDIKGKALGVSVATLLGGPYRTTLPAYVSGIRGETNKEKVADLVGHRDAGFTHFKLFGGFGIEKDTALMEALLKAAPGTVAFDALWRYDRDQALVLGRALEDLGALWFEAPCDPEDVAGHAALARALDLPIAGGETERTRLQFKPWIESGGFDILQPDIGRCGLTEGRRIVDVADLMHLPVTLHCGIASPVMIAASLHVAASSPRVRFMEYQPVVLKAMNRLLKRPLVCRSGAFELPNGVGLGIDFDEPTLMRFAKKVSKP